MTGLNLQDMETAIVGLDTKMRMVANKLHRHEARSRQVNDVTTKTLRAIVTQTAGQSRNVESIAVYMAKMEARLIKMEQALVKNDRKMDQLLDLVREQGTGALQTRASRGSDTSDEVMTKLTTLDGNLNHRMTALFNEAITSRETVMSHLERQDVMINDLSNSLGSASGFSSNLQKTSTSLLDTEAKLAKHTKDAEMILTQFSVGVGVLIDNSHKLGNDSRLVADDVSAIRQDLQRMEEQMDARQVELFSSHYQTSNSQNGDLQSQLQQEIATVVNSTSSELSQLKAELKEIGEERDRMVNTQVETLKEGQAQLTNMVQESMVMAEGLYDRVSQGYDELKGEIQGLSNLEEVMVDTADSVLDTKRRLEYGVQQILLEVEAAVRAQGIKINGTFSSKFGTISEEILASQSVALNNMTKSIESEIAQVWRQIGVMYQTLSTSAQVLDKIDDKTTQYVNGTLEKTEKVDGTCRRRGQAGRRGRRRISTSCWVVFSLVVSEFNQMKSGIGA
ncbi:hypothetical protein FJT64_016377 [Amphibalanus amphitrite]|uniref:Uncharacterized protein n=1 Tax=Amphibalanus amphitrite TaxID=1232801 RepID=A0A6A4WZS6_AMPAM|nr:hypothetical protein FJT64_016377 [Amphibalanus amphitrite]